MKRFLTITSMLIFMFFLLISCGGSKVGRYKIDDDILKFKEDLEASKNTIIRDEGTAAIGLGISPRYDFAKEKAKVDAFGGLKACLEDRIAVLIKSITEGNDYTCDPRFTPIPDSIIVNKVKTQIIIDRLMKAASVRVVKCYKKNQEWNVLVLSELTPDIIKQIILEELLDKTWPKGIPNHIDKQ